MNRTAKVLGQGVRLSAARVWSTAVMHVPQIVSSKSLRWQAVSLVTSLAVPSILTQVVEPTVGHQNRLCPEHDIADSETVD